MADEASLWAVPRLRTGARLEQRPLPLLRHEEDDRAVRVRAPFVQDADFTLYQGDALQVLREMPDASVDCCVTSPPYWGLRDYGHDGQLGLESTPDEYVARLVAVFGEVRRCLTDAGTLWLNLGDSYTSGGRDNFGPSKPDKNIVLHNAKRATQPADLKPKDLVGIPWRVAFALQADGWWLRSDIIWSKPNPMPESVTDRPTKAHEYVFLLSKSPRYFYDADAIAEPATWYGPNGKPKTGPHAGQMHGRAGKNENHIDRRKVGFNERWDAQDGNHSLTRNTRSVWEIQTQQYADAHFAVFPEELPRRCILAGCPEGGTVLDPFGGSGTTALVARKLNRRSVLIELNADYCDLAARRLQQLSLLAEPA